jgi:hypothetical protein
VNYQFWGGVVIGAEAMFDWLPNTVNASITATAPDGTAAFIDTINTTATGRLGYAWDRVLVYGRTTDLIVAFTALSGRLRLGLDSSGMVAAYTIVQGSHHSVYQALTIVQWSCARWPSYSPR